MNEISNILEQKEKVEWEGRPKASAYFASNFITLTLIAGAIILAIWFSQYGRLWLIAVGGLWIILIIITILRYNVIYYVITNKRIVFQKGIIGRDFKSLDYYQIQNVSASVGILGVVFKTGNIRIFTGEIETVSGGTANNQTYSTRSKYDVMFNISNVYSILKNIQTHLSKRKEDLYAGRT